MPYLLFGLGNPGTEYEGTRHNTGAWVARAIQRTRPALAESGSVRWVEGQTFMNESGAAVKKLVKTKKDAAHLIVVQDDLDLPLGAMKISFGRGSGGHRGVESVIKAVKTEQFIRIRIGISSLLPSGKLKKPKPGEPIVKFILGKFKPAELLVLKKVAKKAGEAVETIVEDDLARAMNLYN